MKNLPQEVYLVHVQDDDDKLTNYSIGSKSHAKAKVRYVNSIIRNRMHIRESYPQYYPDGPKIRVTVSKVPAVINWEDVTDQFI